MTSPRLLAAFVAALATLPFAASLGGTFVYDDEHLIVRRTLVHSLASLPTIWTQDFWAGADPVAFRFYRPLVTTTYALDWAVFGASPTGFHATNLALHAFGAALAFLTLRRWLGSVEVAFGCALAWAWHPMRAEAVAWISGRPDLLVGLGLLLCVSGFSLRRQGHRGLGVTLEVAGLFAALTSKESGVVAPALIAVEAWSSLAQPAFDRASLRKIAMLAGPYAAVCIAYGVARLCLLPVTRSGMPAIPLADHGLMIVETLGELSRATLWPMPSTMQRAPLRLDEAGALVHAPWRVVVGVGTGAVLLFCAARRARPSLAVGAVLLAALWFPVSNVIPTRQVWLLSERFTYVPHLAVALLLGVATSAIARPWLRRAALALPIVLLSPHAVARTLELRSPDGFWEREHAIDPDAPMPLKHMAHAALRASRSEDALALAIQGSRTARTYAGQEATAVSLAATAGEAMSNLTPDRDRAAVAAVHDFFVALLSGTGRATLATPRGSVSVPAGSRDALVADAMLPVTIEWSARAAARAGACDRALTLLADTAARPSVRGALVLARCDRWDAASTMATKLDAQRAAPVLAPRLREAAAALAREATTLGHAVARSNARTLLEDDRGALAELSPWREELLVQAPELLAEKMWALGDEGAATALLRTRLPEEGARDLVERWRRSRARR